MKLKVKSIDHIRLVVEDLSTAIAYAQELFDFEIFQQYEFGNYAIIGNQYVKLCLSEYSSEVRAKGTIIDGPILHFGFHVENWEEVYDRVKKYTGEEPFVYDWEHGAQSIYIYGPLGEIELTKIAGADLHITQ